MSALGAAEHYNLSTLAINHHKALSIDVMAKLGQMRELDRLIWQNGAFVFSDNSDGLVVSPVSSKLMKFHCDHGAIIMHEEYAARQ